MDYRRKAEWNRSYQNRDNFVFYPYEKVIHFVSRDIRKQTGLNAFRGVAAELGKFNILDLGCLLAAMRFIAMK